MPLYLNAVLAFFAIVMLLTALAFVTCLALIAAGGVAKLRRQRSRGHFQRAAMASVATLGLTVVMIVLAAVMPKDSAGTTAASHTAQTRAPVRSRTAAPKIVVHRPVRAPKRAGRLPDFIALVVGVHGFLESNNEGDGRMGTLFDDIDTARRWATGQFSGPEDLPHHDLPVGTPVVVQSWETMHGAGSDLYVMLEVPVVARPSLHGFVRDISVLPAVPPGTHLIVKGLGRFRKGQNVSMDVSGDSDSLKVLVPIGSIATVLRYDDRATGLSPYVVQIASGNSKGARGYLGPLALGVVTNGHVPTEEYDPGCDCVGLFLLEAHERRP